MKYFVHFRIRSWGLSPRGVLPSHHEPRAQPSQFAQSETTSEAGRKDLGIGCGGQRRFVNHIGGRALAAAHFPRRGTRASRPMLSRRSSGTSCYKSWGSLKAFSCLLHDGIATKMTTDVGHRRQGQEEEGPQAAQVSVPNWEGSDKLGYGVCWSATAG